MVCSLYTGAVHPYTVTLEVRVKITVTLGHMVCLTPDLADFSPPYPTPVPSECRTPLRNNYRKNADPAGVAWKNFF